MAKLNGYILRIFYFWSRENISEILSSFLGLKTKQLELQDELATIAVSYDTSLDSDLN